jgi:hypothetical protein
MELKIEKNKYSPAEVALLGVFALGLLLSFLLVANRKKIPMSSPVIADFDGLEVSVPLGRGWQSYGRWIFSNSKNAHVLQSVLKKSSSVVAQASWIYQVSPEKKSREEIVNQKSSGGHFSKARFGKIKSGGLDFKTIIFTSLIPNFDAGVEDYYYASCDLPFERQLRLEVRTAGDADLAERTFKAAIKGLKFSEDPRLLAGEDFVKKLKATGANAMLKRETAGTFERVYFVENDNRKTVRKNVGSTEYAGFTLELFSPVKDLQGRPGVNTSGLYFIGGSDGWTGRSHFDCNRSFDYFHWQTEQFSTDNKVGNRVILECKHGALQYRGQTFPVSSLSLPEIFFDSAAAVFYDSGDTNLLVDLILPDAQIIPTEISRVDLPKKLSTSEVDTAIRFTLYNADESYYEILFDKGGNIVGKTEKTNRSFKLKKTSIKEVTDYFKKQKNDINEMQNNM